MMSASIRLGQNFLTNQIVIDDGAFMLFQLQKMHCTLGLQARVETEHFMPAFFGAFDKFIGETVRPTAGVGAASKDQYPFHCLSESILL